MSSSGQPGLNQSVSFGSGTFSGTRTLANRYELQKKLGSGNFGTAYLVKDLKAEPGSKEEWKVAKQMSVGDIMPDETVDAMKEGRLLSKLNHPNIVKFYDSFFDNEMFCIVTEFCEGGDLKSKIADAKKKATVLDEPVVLDWFVQLMLAVEYIHNRRILHRDLTTGNVFLKNEMIKLGDFGISRVLMGTCDMASTFTGTPYYMSPEVLKHDGYNSKSDIWSVGCILYELCTLNHAFEGQGLMGVMYKIVEGEIPKLPSRFSPELNEIYLKILTRDIHKRPSATEVLQTPFMSAQIERLKAQLEASVGAAVVQKASSEQLEKEARDISQLINEPAHLEDLRRTMGFTSSDTPSQNIEPPVASNDSTVIAKSIASTIKGADPASVTVKASETVKPSSAKSVSIAEPVTEKPNSGNLKPTAPSSAAKAKVPTPTGKVAAGPVAAAKAPRLKTATPAAKAPGGIKREPTQFSVKASTEPTVAPEDIAAAEAEFLRSLKQQRESGGFKATYETSDQLKQQPAAARKQVSSDYNADADAAVDEEEEYRQAKEAERTVGINNLSPTQQMLLRKRSEADRKAHALKQVTQETYLTQKAMKEGFRETVQGTARKSLALSPDDQYQLDYTVEIPVQQQQQARPRFMGDGDLLSRSMAPVRDDRPITPMKKDIYKDGSRELEFQNGIPVNPQVADFYYSYYDEFEDAPAEQPQVSQSFNPSRQHSSSNRQSHSFVNNNRTQRIRFVAQDGDIDDGLKADDEKAQLANYMATVLTRPSLPQRSMTIMDDDSSHHRDAFGPSARQAKIKTMRNDCERKLGPVKFRQVYDYLKDARSGNTAADGNSEQRINNDLRRMLGNPHDAFLVDQLLFLETMGHSG